MGCSHGKEHLSGQIWNNLSLEKYILIYECKWEGILESIVITTMGKGKRKAFLYTEMLINAHIKDSRMLE